MPTIQPRSCIVVLIGFDETSRSGDRLAFRGVRVRKISITSQEPIAVVRAFDSYNLMSRLSHMSLFDGRGRPSRPRATGAK
jgi:hypothetical protein